MIIIDDMWYIYSVGVNFMDFVWLMFAVDIYVSCVSSTHNVTAKGFYLVLVATTVETDNPEEELKPGLELLGEIKEK